MKKQNKLNVYMPCGSRAYEKFLESKFNVHFMKEYNEGFYPNLVLYTGGADVSPSYYNEKIGDFTTIDKDRDQKEFDIFDKLRGVPSLGICRGAQFLCVASGGKLIQHVTGHAIGGEHNITINRNGTTAEVGITSTHHQMMYPFNLRDNHYEIIAHSTNFLSNMYLNGDNENLSVPRKFLEPEIVVFKKHGTNLLAIQGHPEFDHCPKITRSFCLRLISETFNFKKFEKNEK